MKSTSNQAHHASLIARVREAFAGVSGVEEKRMFGSTAFMVRGKMCVAARAERIMCRIAPARHDAAIERPGCQTVIMGGRQYRGYVYVTADTLKTQRALKYWIRLALEHNKTQAKNPDS